jgi:hypothetical protein
VFGGLRPINHAIDLPEFFPEKEAKCSSSRLQLVVTFSFLKTWRSQPADWVVPPRNNRYAVGNIDLILGLASKKRRIDQKVWGIYNKYLEESKL